MGCATNRGVAANACRVALRSRGGESGGDGAEAGDHQQDGNPGAQQPSEQHGAQDEQDAEDHEGGVHQLVPW